MSTYKKHRAPSQRDYFYRIHTSSRKAEIYASHKLSLILTSFYTGLVGWQSEIIDGQYSMVVALTVKGFSKLFEELTKEHRPIIYLIDRAEAFDAKALKNGGSKKTKALSN